MCIESYFFLGSSSILALQEYVCLRWEDGVWGLCLGVEDGVCGGIVWRRDIVCGEVGKGVVWGKVEVRVP